MILDTLPAAERYFVLHPGFPAAFDHLRTILQDLPSAGRHEFGADRLDSSVAECRLSLRERMPALSRSERRQWAAVLPSTGRLELDGPRLYASIDRSQARGRDAANLEVHRRYIDIQVCLAGQETIGWRPLAECAAPKAPFDTGRDIQFFTDPPQSWFDLAPGLFAIFYPDDAHAPLAGAGEVLKVVMKVAVDWQPH